MTKADSTLVAVLMDRSGSIRGLESDFEGGLASLIEEQKKLPGELKVTLAQFDDQYELVYPPTDADDIPEYELVPRGMTALHDAMGKFIIGTGVYLANLPEDERPSSVIVVILTDGHENSSFEWKADAIRDLVTEQESVYNWKFVFIGANIDAVTTAAQFGIRADSALTYDTSKTAQTFNVASSYLSTTRAFGDAQFSDQDRSAVV